MSSSKAEFLKPKTSVNGRCLWLDMLQFFLPITIIILGMFVGSQLYAKAVRYNEVYVDMPVHIFHSDFLFFKKGYRLYNPFFTFILIFTKPFDKKVQETCSVFFQPWSVFIVGGVAVFFFLGILRQNRNKNDKVYGTGRLATEKDLKKFGLTLQNGVVLGEFFRAVVDFKVNPENSSISLFLKKSSKLICHGGGTNTLGIAPTRAGKGVSWINPTLLSYLQSVIVFDPKGELYRDTAGFRMQFSRVLKFSPISKATIRFNPLEEVELTEQAFADIGLILANVFEPPAGGSDGTNEFFDNAAQTLLTALIFHVLSSGIYPKDMQNMAGINSILSQASGNNNDKSGGEGENESALGDELLNEMKAAPHFDKNGERAPYIDRIISDAANQILSMHEKVRSDTFSTVFTKMRLFQDPYIAYCTSCSDFKLSDFYDSKEPISLYLTVPFSHIDRIAPIFKLVINFILRKFSDGEMLPKGQKGIAPKKLKNRILFMLDEFPVLGKLPFISKVMGILAGYGINFFIIVQMLSQIVDLYGQHHTFLDNCKTVLVMAPGNIDDATKFSQMVGKESVVKGSTSMSGSRFSMGLNNLNQSQQDIARDIINPDELMHMSPDCLLIFNQGMPAYLAKKVVFYMDERFMYKAYKEDDEGNCVRGWLAPYEQKQIQGICAALPSNIHKSESAYAVIKRAYEALPPDEKIQYRGTAGTPDAEKVEKKSEVDPKIADKPFSISEFLENYDGKADSWEINGEEGSDPDGRIPPGSKPFNNKDFQRKETMTG